jgi:diaminohydroxyphosphoribosylaminopyrimidine deaminase/5-amino-6-(5-phosphoribosylamino)uracil reductase
VRDEDFLRLAFELAERGEGDVSPNPLVGAVVVRDGLIVGRGFHRAFGGPHAEVFALDEAGERSRGATLYVTLEPCAHFGKTPPCTERILRAGVDRVVVSVLDPNPIVSGRGVSALREAGVRVDVGCLADLAARQNEIFFKYIRTRRPFVHLKLATSLDGRIATKTGDARWITGEPARLFAHRLRRRHAAVLIGIGTALADDPELTVRHVVGKQPVPIVVDADARLPLTARILRGDRQPILAAAHVEAARRAAFESHGCRVWELPTQRGGVDLPALLERLGHEGVDSVLVEGGGETAAAFLDAQLVDRVSFIIAPLLIGGRGAVPAVGGEGPERLAEALRLEKVTADWVGDDLIYSGLIRREPAA